MLQRTFRIASVITGTSLLAVGSSVRYTRFEENNSRDFSTGDRKWFNRQFEDWESKFRKSVVEKINQVTNDDSFVSKVESFKDLAVSLNFFMYSKSQEEQRKALEDLLKNAQKNSKSGAFQSNMSFMEIYEMFRKDTEAIKIAFKNKFGHLDVTNIDPTALFYYLEREDEIKNPSWKRRKHRYTLGASDAEVEVLHDWLSFADFAYYDNVTMIQEDLPIGWKLITSRLESLSRRPAHYAAVNTSNKETTMVIVARGTKGISDVLTDALLDATSYRGGLAHRGMVEAGKWLAGEYVDLVKKMKSTVGPKMKLVIVGHSLGAGAATIAGMELMDTIPGLNLEVIGFGCPSLFSKELCQQCEGFVTTVVADSDIIPRSSAETIANFYLNVLHFDYSDRAKRDIDEALEEFKKRFPTILSEKDLRDVSSNVKKFLELDGPVAATDKEGPQYLKPILYPPGNVLHIYRDGIGYSCSWTPCEFFGEVDMSRTMISDHLITGYDRNFKGLLRKNQN